MSSARDATLVAQARAGDREAVGELPERRVSSRSRAVPRRLTGVVAPGVQETCIPNSHEGNDLGQIRPATEISFDVFCRVLQIYS